jgi:sporulation-control protein spo0M
VCPILPIGDSLLCVASELGDLYKITLSTDAEDPQTVSNVQVSVFDTLQVLSEVDRRSTDKIAVRTCLLRREHFSIGSEY